MKEPKKQIYNDVWFFYKKYINATSDEEWDILVAESKELIEKHQNDPFAKDLLYAV